VFVYRELWDESLVTVRDVARQTLAVSKDEPIVMRLIDPAAQEHERTSGTASSGVSRGRDPVHGARRRTSTPAWTRYTRP